MQILMTVHISPFALAFKRCVRHLPPQALGSEATQQLGTLAPLWWQKERLATSWTTMPRSFIKSSVAMISALWKKMWWRNTSFRAGAIVGLVLELWRFWHVDAEIELLWSYWNYLSWLFGTWIYLFLIWSIHVLILVFKIIIYIWKQTR